LEAAKKQRTQLKMLLGEAMNLAEPIKLDYDGQRFIDPYRGNLAVFWQRPPAEINQVLHDVIGSARLYVTDGVFVAVR